MKTFFFTDTDGLTRVVNLDQMISCKISNEKCEIWMLPNIIHKVTKTEDVKRLENLLLTLE